MRQAILATALLVLGAPAAHAGQSAISGSPWGVLCGLTSASGPTGAVAGGDVQAGEVNAGPLYLASGSVTCTVQVGDAHYTGANRASVSASGTGVVVVAPAPVSFVADGAVYVCTQVSVDGSALYLDDETGMWSRDPVAASCSIATETAPAGVGRSSGNGHAYGHQKVKPPNDDDPPPPPPSQPFYPTGAVEIAQRPGSPVTYAFTDFTPAAGTWTCTPSGYSVTCIPPPPAAGFTNVCGTVDVSVASPVAGRVAGTSGCATGPAAGAAEDGPSLSATSSSASPAAAFPWTCTAAPQGAVVWSVACRVGP